MPSVWAPSTSSGYTSTAVYAEPCRASSPTCGPFPCEITSSCSSATGARAAQAAWAFARWFSAVSGSPRRSSAFPPSATTTRTSQLPRVATMTALIVCIRFSASSKTSEAGDSKTSSVTSSASIPNFS